MKIKVIAIDSCTACITFCTEKPSTIFFFFFTHKHQQWMIRIHSQYNNSPCWVTQTRQERQERTILLWLQLKARRCPTRSNHSSHFKGLRAATVTSTGDRLVNQRVHKNRSRLSANRFSHCHLSSCAIKETSIFIPAASLCFFFFSLWLHCRNSSIISSVLQNHNGATFQSREETISSPPPLPRVDEFTLESKKKLSIFHHPFPFCMWFFFRCCGKYGQEVGIKSDLYQRAFATVSTPAASQERQRVDSFCEGGNGATIGSAFRHFGGHTSRPGKKKKDGAMNTLFWEHRFWQCPSILIISWLLCQCSL